MKCRIGGIISANHRYCCLAVLKITANATRDILWFVRRLFSLSPVKQRQHKATFVTELKAKGYP